MATKTLKTCLPSNINQRRRVGICYPSPTRSALESGAELWEVDIPQKSWHSGPQPHAANSIAIVRAFQAKAALAWNALTIERSQNRNFALSGRAEPRGEASEKGYEERELAKWKDADKGSGRS